MGKLTKFPDEPSSSALPAVQPRSWPRRLLHVSSMTSYERSANNEYGGIRKPSYNAISYTWGRFQDKSHATPGINIKGVTWKIPGIQPSHFTVDEFQTAIKRAAENQEFLWLDIACIDQENATVKLDEINRQAAIFKGARHVYAWMTPWTTGQMLRSMHTLVAFNASLGFPDLGYKLLPAVNVGAVDRPSLHRAVEDISKQGWFTSLWTLQEAWLSSPYIMSRSSETATWVMYHNGQKTNIEMNTPVGLLLITSEFSKIWRALLKERTPESRLICNMIVNSGVISIDTREASLLYCAAARRQHRRPEDAVYGIMQVYNVQMPAMVDINALLNSFALVLNSRNPIATQLFIHTQPVEPLRAWRFSRHTAIPMIFQLEPLGNKTDCKVEGGMEQRPIFTGDATSAANLFAFWAAVQQSRRGTLKPPFLPHIYLDASDSTSCQYVQVRDEESAPTPRRWQSFEDSQTVSIVPGEISKLFKHPLGTYRVLRLGKMLNCPLDIDVDSNEQWELHHHIGLLVLQHGKQTDTWNRVGYCSWIAQSQCDIAPPEGQTVVSPPDVIETPASIWQSFTCFLG